MSPINRECSGALLPNPALLDSSHAPDVPGYRVLKGQVRQVFDLIKAGQFEPYTSALAMGEIESDQNKEHREQMESLVNVYIQAGAVPAAYFTDAAHEVLDL